MYIIENEEWSFIPLKEKLRHKFQVMNEAFSSEKIRSMHNTQFATNWAEIYHSIPITWDKIKDSDLTEITSDDLLSYDVSNLVKNKNPNKIVGEFSELVEIYREYVDSKNVIYQLGSNVTLSVRKIADNNPDNTLAQNIISRLEEEYQYPSPNLVEYVKDIKTIDPKSGKDLEKMLQEREDLKKKVEKIVQDIDKIKNVVTKEVDGLTYWAKSKPLVLCLNKKDELTGIIYNGGLAWSGKKLKGAAQGKDLLKNADKAFEKNSKFYVITDATPFLTEEMRRTRASNKQGALVLLNAEKQAEQMYNDTMKKLKMRTAKTDFLAIDTEPLIDLFESCKSVVFACLNQTFGEIDTRKTDKILYSFKNVVSYMGEVQERLNTAKTQKNNPNFDWEFFSDRTNYCITDFKNTCKEFLNSFIN